MSLGTDPGWPASPAPGPAAGDIRQQVAAGQAASNGAAALHAVDLTLSFGQRAILSDVSTEIRRGAVTALIGPTGSGKTTLLRTFNRMNDKVTGYRHAGDVLLDGRSIWHPGVELMSLRRKVGMLFQRPNPFPMSIIDNVVAGARVHRLASKNGLKEIARASADRGRALGRRPRPAEGLAIPAVRRPAATALPGPCAGHQPGDPAA